MVTYHFDCCAPDAGRIICDTCGWFSRVEDGESYNGVDCNKEFKEHCDKEHPGQELLKVAMTGSINSRF